MKDAVIADFPPADGREWDCQCARCGSSVEFDPCEWCDGAGHFEEDYDEIGFRAIGLRVEACDECVGRGVRHYCVSDREWCEANPSPGREDVKRGAVEWFVSPRSLS